MFFGGMSLCFHVVSAAWQSWSLLVTVDPLALRRRLSPGLPLFGYLFWLHSKAFALFCALRNRYLGISILQAPNLTYQLENVNSSTHDIILPISITALLDGG